MQQPVYFAPLGSKDARRISRLQKKLFARALTEPEHEIRQILRNTEEYMVCNLRFYGLALTVKDEARREGRPPYKLLRLDVADSTVELRQQGAALPDASRRSDGGATVTVLKDPRQWLSLKDRW